MPINKVYDLNVFLRRSKKFLLRIIEEELMSIIKDVIALTQLLNYKESQINLIPFNKLTGSQYENTYAH